MDVSQLIHPLVVDECHSHLFECPSAIQAWCDVNLWNTINRILHHNYSIDALIFNLLHQLPSAQSELFVELMETHEHETLAIEERNKHACN